MFEADAEALKRLLRENQAYLDNYLELYCSLEDDEYVARGNGFCDRRYSDDFIEGQIEKYRAWVAEQETWLRDVESISRMMATPMDDGQTGVVCGTAAR